MGRTERGASGGPRARLGERERALRLQLQRVVRAQLHLVGLRQVAPAQPDRLACTPRRLTQRAAGSLPALLRPVTLHAGGLHTLQVTGSALHACRRRMAPLTLSDTTYGKRPKHL